MSVEAPIIRSKDDEDFCTIDVNKALLELRHYGGGPVHINLFTSYSHNFNVRTLPPVRVINRYCFGNEMPSLPNGKIGICVGSHTKFTERLTNAVDYFCSCNNAVVFCDHTSGYHGKYRVQQALVITQLNYASPNQKVDLAIHIGEVSGDYKGLNIYSKAVWRVNEDGELRDTYGKLTKVFEMSEELFFEYYSKQSTSQTKKDFLESCNNEYNSILSKIPEIPFGNIWIANSIASKIPSGSELHLGILNSLRSWNLFKTDNSVDVFSNVGGFGIDGCVSSLIGASLINPQKLYFGVVGDLAFFYDLNSLGNRHIRNNLRLLVVNNGKGGEFRNYRHPCSEFGEEAEPYMAASGHFGKKSLTLVKDYVESLGFDYLSAHSKESFMSVADKFLNPQIASKSIVLEAFVDSQDDCEALKLISNYIVDAQAFINHKAKDALKKVIGIQGVEKLKQIVK